MVKGVWFFEVTGEKQEEFLQKAREVIKPYWESQECIAYNIYQDYTNPTLFVKEQIYADIESMEKDGALFFERKDPKAVEVVELFRSYATNIQNRLCHIRLDEDGLHPRL